MDKVIAINDNLTIEQTIKETKEFLGLNFTQSFQEIEIDEADYNE